MMKSSWGKSSHGLEWNLTRNKREKSCVGVLKIQNSLTGYVNVQLCNLNNLNNNVAFQNDFFDQANQKNSSENSVRRLFVLPIDTILLPVISLIRSHFLPVALVSFCCESQGDARKDFRSVSTLDKFMILLLRLPQLKLSLNFTVFKRFHCARFVYNTFTLINRCFTTEMN